MKSILVLFVLIIINLVNGLCPHEIANLVRWSQWNKAPSSSGATVNIDASSAILLDVSPPVIEHIDVYGTLVFDPNVPTIDLTVGSVYVRNGGKMYLGTSECPMNKTIVNINLIGSPRVGVDPEGLGTKVLGVKNGGLLEIHGKPRKATWTVLESSASINSSQITLTEDVDWAVGETIIIATTDFEVFNDEKGYPLSQNEQVVITSRPSPTSVTFSPPLKYMHYGKIWTGQNGDFVDMRGEVALISRNILIKGDLSTELSGDSEAKQWGGHVMIRDGGVARIEHIEVTKMGQRGEFGRYPLHFHNSSSAPNSYLRGNSIHDTFQRCIVVHSTHDLRIQNNVAYKGKGHCYFVEDGNEERNVFDHNIGIKPVVGDLLTSDSEPAVFWITNPNNHYYKNVAVGGKFGYWYAMPESPLALSAAQVTNKLRSRLSGDFIGNKAHSSNIGLFVDRGQENAKPGTNNRLTDYNPTNMTAALLLAAELGVPVDVSKLSAYDLSVSGFRAPAYFVDFTAYKSMEEGMWGRGSYMFSYGAKLADNQVGAIWPGYANMMQKTIIVGETDNIGTFNTVANKWWGDEEGRSRATKYFIHNPVLGYSSYDASGGDIVMDINFYNFNDYTFTLGDNAGKIRKTGALTGLTGPNVIEPINRIYRAKFFNVQRRVYYREFYPWEQNLAETDDAVKGIVWVDADGSILAGTPEAGCGKTIVGSGAVVRNSNCVQKADWNAYICNANTNAHRAVYVNQNAKPTSYLSPEEIRLSFDLHFHRLNDNAKVNVAPDLGKYSDSLMAADFRYGTNLIVNNNYYVTLGNKNTFLSNFNMRMNNMEVGEKIRFVFPFSGTSTPKVMAGYNADQPTKEVSSYSQLVENSYFQDKAANLLWIHLEVDSMDYSYYQNLPFGLSYAFIQVSSDCVKNSDNLCSYPERAAPANPGNLPQVAANLCETSGAITNGIKTYTKKDSSEYVLFGDSLPSSFDNKTNENCVVSNNLVQDGSSSLRCKYKSYAYGGYNRLWAADPPILSVSPFTHVQVSVRVAPGHGDIKLSMALFNRSWTHAPWVPLHSPFYTEDAGPITEKKWTVCTVPIGDFQFPAGQNLWGFAITVNLPRPVEFYLDNIKFVSLTSTLAPISNYPVAPPAPSRVGPGPSTEYGTDPPVVDTSGSGSTTSYIDPNIKDSASSLSFSLFFIIMGVLLSML